MVLGELDSHIQKNRSGALFVPLTGINSSGLKTWT